MQNVMVTYADDDCPLRQKFLSKLSFRHGYGGAIARGLMTLLEEREQGIGGFNGSLYLGLNRREDQVERNGLRSFRVVSGTLLPRFTLPCADNGASDEQVFSIE